MQVEEILNFDWIKKHTDKGVSATLLYSENMEDKVKKLLKLNPDITCINPQKATYTDTSAPSHERRRL